MKTTISSRKPTFIASICLLFCHVVFAEEPAVLEFSAGELVIPLKEGSVHPIAVVGIGDDAGLNVVVDTGASVNVIDTAIAEANGYTVIGETAVGAPGGAMVPANIVRIPELSIGTGVIRNAEFVTLDIRSMTGGLMDGVIGMPVFGEHLLTFDQAQNQIRVAQESLAPGSAGVIAYNDVSGHVQIDVDVAGTTVATHIDTGSMASFTLPVELETELPLMEASSGQSSARLVGGDRSVRHAQLDGDIVFAGKRYEDPSVGFMDPSPGYANVGSGILRDFVVSIDQRNRLIRFRQNTNEAERDSRPRRLGVQFRGFPGGSSLTVGSVDSGSLGEQYGVMSGDVLVAVNDKPTGDYDMQALGAVIRGPDPLTLEFLRDGSPLTIEIP